MSAETPDKPDAPEPARAADFVEAEAYLAGVLRWQELGRGAREILRREGSAPPEDAPEAET